jgi:transposase
MLGMDEVTVIRHRVLVQGVSRRAIAKELGVSRNTVRRYLAGASAGERKPVERPRPVSERCKTRLEELLETAPRWTQGKQRLTATQLHRMLRAEGLSVGVTLVKEYVHEWKRRRAEVFVPLIYRPGDLGEVDFFQVFVDVAGKRIKAWMFLLRLMASGRDFAWLYPQQDQTCFLDGHVRAFTHLGGVPHRLAYDNLKPAVARVLAGSERELTARFLAVSNHYLFEPCFARPATGHDKGGVEARGKGVRWQHLVPIPAGDSLNSVSAHLLARLDTEAQSKRNPQGQTVMARFLEEQAALLPLPAASFRAAAARHATASRRALMQLEGGTYSVWSRWAGLQLVAHVGVDAVEIVGPDGVVTHPKRRFGGRSIDYRHYLPELAKKPQALRQVAEALIPNLAEPYARAWRQLIDEHGPKVASRLFAQVLKAVVDRGEEDVARVLERALASGEPIQLALRPAVYETVVALEALPASLREVEVPSASAASFDVLLGGER